MKRLAERNEPGRTRRGQGRSWRLLQAAMLAGGSSLVLVASMLFVMDDGPGERPGSADAFGTLADEVDAGTELTSEALSVREAPDVGGGLPGVDTGALYAAVYQFVAARQAELAPAATPPPPTATAVPPTAEPTAAPQVSTSLACPSAGIRGYALSLFHAINYERTSRALPALAADGCLAHVAQLHASDMAGRGYFAHVTPEGDTVFVWLGRYGYGFATAGENLARNDYAGDQSVAVAIRDLMASPSHRANILGGGYARMGVAAAVDATGMRYFTMIYVG